MEDGLFPSYMTITGDDPEELEEERRLCYVGITRAEQKLTLTGARMRMVRGETRYNKLSRFVKEIRRNCWIPERVQGKLIPRAGRRQRVMERAPGNSPLPHLQKEASSLPEREESLSTMWETVCVMSSSEKGRFSISKRADGIMK